MPTEDGGGRAAAEASEAQAWMVRRWRGGRGGDGGGEAMVGRIWLSGGFG